MWAIRKQPASTAAAIGAAVLATAVAVLYEYVIAGQGEANLLGPRLIGASLVFASLVLLASTLTAKTPARLLLLSLGSFTLLIWTVLGAFSIGVLLLPAALLALFAASRTALLLPTDHAWAIVTIAAAVSLVGVALVVNSS
jgi:hypothetical protein